MTAEVWATLGVFGALQIIAFVALVLNMKSDNNMLKVQMADVQETLKELGTVLVRLAETRGRQDLLDERLLTQGKRLDELSRRFNHERDRS